MRPRKISTRKKPTGVGERVPDVAPSGVPASEWLFWDCRLSSIERLLLVILTALVFALNLDPIQKSGYITYITAMTAVLSWLTPFTGFFFTACSQFLPYPDNAAMNPAQIGFITWAIMLPVRYRKFDLRGAQHLAILVPLFIWMLLTRGEISEILSPNSNYVKALVYAFMAAQLVNASKGRYMKCLLGLALGSLMITAAYWSYFMGLPIAISEYGATRAGMARFGGVRADAVMVWPAVLFAIAGLMGVATASPHSTRPPNERKWLVPFAVVGVLLAIPTLISTMTTGGYGGFVLLILAYLVLLKLCFPRRSASRHERDRLVRYVMLGVLAVVVLIMVDALGLRTRMEAMWEYQEDATTESGIATSRTGVWKASLATIRQYPLFGVKFSGRLEDVAKGYGKTGYYLSHNVFLDFARGSGIPGMLLFMWFFFYPFVEMFRQRDRRKFFPFLLLHFSFFIFFMGLSFVFYKTFWAGWMLMTMAAKSGQPGRTPVAPNGPPPPGPRPA